MNNLMKSFASVFFFLLVFGPGASLADTDYICLKACIGNSGTYTACVPKCSYDTSTSSADTHPYMDITCMKGCVDSGGTSSACVPQCTNAAPQSTSALSSADAAHANASTHNPFNPPVPYDGILLSQPNRAGQHPLNLDYGCLHLCVQGGMQYQLCDQRCTH